MVSRHTYSSWDGESPEGAQLLKTCCDIVQESANALNQADDPDALASYEHAAEALSVLCMHYGAKVHFPPFIGTGAGAACFSVSPNIGSVLCCRAWAAKG